MEQGTQRASLLNQLIRLVETKLVEYAKDHRADATVEVLRENPKLASRLMAKDS